MTADYAIPGPSLPGSLSFTIRTPRAVELDPSTAGNGDQKYKVTIDDSVNTAGNGSDASHTFRLGFADSNGVYHFTSALADSIGPTALEAALVALPGIGNQTATISGTATAGDKVQLTFNGGALSNETVSYTVKAGDTLNAMAAGLVAAAQADTNLTGIGFAFDVDSAAVLVSNPNAGTYTLGQNVTGAATETIALNTAADVNVSGSSGGPFTIEFQNALGNTPETLRGVGSADELAAIPLDLGFNFGNLAHLAVTKGMLDIYAGFAAGMTFGVDLSPNVQPIVGAPATTPSTGVTLLTPPGGVGVTGQSGAVEDIVVHNVDSGTFKLGWSVSGSGSGVGAVTFSSNSSTLQSNIQAALNSITGLNGNATVGAATTNAAGDLVFAVTFDKSLGDVRTSFSVADDETIGPATKGAQATGSPDSILANSANFSVQLFNTQTVSGQTHSSTTIDHLSTTQGLSVGMIVIGNGIQAGTTIASIATTTLTGSTTSGSTTMSVSTTGLSEGEIVTGATVATGTTIHIAGLNTVTLSRAATGNASSASFTFYPTSLQLSQTATATNINGENLTFVSPTAVENFASLSVPAGTYSPNASPNPPVKPPLPANAGLAAAVQQAIDNALNGAGYGLGFLHTADPVTHTLPIADGHTFTAPGVAASNTSIANDIPLTLTGSAISQPINLVLRVTNVAAAGSVEAALNALIGGSALKVANFTITVGDDGAGHITITPHGGTLNVDYGDGQSQQLGGTVDPSTGITSPIMAASGAQGVFLRAPSVTVQSDANAAPIQLDRFLQVSVASFTDPAYQQLGLSAVPTKFSGQLSNSIDLHLVVNGVDAHVTFDKSLTTSNSSIAQLIGDNTSGLQKAVDDALVAAGFSAGQVFDAATNTYLVKVQLVPKANGSTDTTGSNRIEFVGKSGVVTSLAINVPAGTNGAITDLGFPAGNGAPQAASAGDAALQGAVGGAFLDNASLSASLTLLAEPLSATASLGFIGVNANGGASLVADASLSLVDPATGASKVYVTSLAQALSGGLFLHTGPNTGPISGKISGAGAAELVITPNLGGLTITGLSGISAEATISLDIPDLLTAPPMLFNDPLGFAHSTITFDGSTVFPLGVAAPSNGQLTGDVSFVIGSGGKEQVGVLKASDTSSNTSLSQLETELQTAINTAITNLNLGGSITVADNGSGIITLTGTSGLKFRGNTFQFSFIGPDISNALDLFNQFSSGFSFSNVIAGLQQVVQFLDQLTAKSPGSVVSEVLNTKLPLVNKSVTDLVNMAASFSNLLNQLQQNPASSISQLESLLETVLGHPASGS